MINIDLSSMVQGVHDGELNPLKLITEIRAIQSRLKEAEAEIEGAVHEALERYTENEISFNGFKITKRKGATRYSYKGNPDWDQLDGDRKELEAFLKQSYLAFQKGALVATKDGEEIILPTPTYAKDGYSIKFVG